jgi:sugar O-acyltransferase (sialic acid O-acetyltransferase NeuD family)
VTNDLVIVGCGGHGREAATIVAAVNEAAAGKPHWTLRGFVDDNPAERNLRRVERLGLSYLGPVGWLDDAPPGTHTVVAIGAPAARRAVAERVRLPFASLVHPDATLGADLRAGPGLLVFPGARVTTNVVLGRHVHLNQNCTVGHDCTFGDYVSVNPLAAVSGECRLDDGVLVGTTAAILQGRHVGEGATVGAGACVVRDVAAKSVVKGVPAR